MPCVLCPIYRPDATPRQPHTPQVCDPDRRILHRHLMEIADCHHRLLHPDRDDTADDSLYTVTYRRLARGELVGWTSIHQTDPVGQLGGAGPVPGENPQPRVSGSRNPAAPTPLDALDLTLPARPATRHLYARAALGVDPDQIGTLSVATILDTWVRDWRHQLWPDHHLPVPTVASLTEWLHHRAHDACDQHPGIADFAEEIRETRTALRSALGEIPAPPETERFKGVPCRSCDMRTLFRRPGDEYIECRNCGLLSTESEYADWRDRLAAYHRTIGTPTSQTR